MDKENLLEEILNGSNQMIHISYADSYEMIYANEPAKKFGGSPDKNYHGVPCYKYMMGLDAPCPFCPMNKMDNTDSREAELDNGSQIFVVKTRCIEWHGRKAFIEYAWDITSVRRSQKIYEAQVQTLLRSIPHAQGVFQLDITDDVCLSSSGISRYAKNFKNGSAVNVLIEQAAEFIPDAGERNDFRRFFSREAAHKGA